MKITKEGKRGEKKGGGKRGEKGRREEGRGRRVEEGKGEGVRIERGRGGEGRGDLQRSFVSLSVPGWKTAIVLMKESKSTESSPLLLLKGRELKKEGF